MTKAAIEAIVATNGGITKLRALRTSDVSHKLWYDNSPYKDPTLNVPLVISNIGGQDVVVFETREQTQNGPQIKVKRFVQCEEITEIIMSTD